MLHESFDIFRIKRLRTHYPFHFLSNSTNLRLATVSAVANIGNRCLAAKALYGCNHSALEAVIVIGA